MAGQPHLQVISRLIEENGGDDWLFEQLAERSIIVVASELKTSRWTLYNWRDSVDSRKAGWTRALKLRSHALLEEGNNKIDHMANLRLPTSAQVQQAREVAGWKAAFAAKLNPEDYGERNPVPQITIGTLHLHSLQAGNVPLLPQPIEDAQIVDDDSSAA